MTFQLEEIRFAYTNPRRQPREVFDDLSIRIGRGECVGIIGREGSGKTTLLNLLGGITRPDRGTLLCDGMDPWKSRNAGASLRRRIGYTFQFPDEQLSKSTVAEEFLPRPGSPARGKMEESLLRAGLDPELFPSRSPFTLSLGESRRVAIALLLAQAPDAAILDEPTAGLDDSGVTCVLAAISGMRARGATIIVATHDVNFLAECVDRVVILDGGRIAADADSRTVLSDGVLLGRFGYGVPDTVAVINSLGGRGTVSAGQTLREKDLLEALSRLP